MNQRPEPTTFIALTPTMRQLIENVVEDLLLLLDELNGDADLEDDDVSEDADTGIADDSGLMEQTHRLPSPA